ncbi:hypothetical protein [Streptomyces anulatus]|uniref:hypothetical protein n=1 Tax=Streptomyces anulatus TaxID=1892 RepID=UPI0033F2FADD
MSGFARDPRYYGDRLVYEPLERKWVGYHARHCGCGLNWLEAEPVTEAQVKYLTTLAEKVGKERFDAEFAKAIKGSDIAPRAPQQRCATAAKRLTKARARKLITALVGQD